MRDGIFAAIEGKHDSISFCGFQEMPDFGQALGIPVSGFCPWNLIILFAMKILMVQRFDLQTVSCARRILAMAGELAVRGHQVTLTNFPNPERREEIPVLVGNLPRDIEYLELNRTGGGVFRNRKRVMEAACGADLIHLWKCYPDAAIPALWASTRLGKPLHYDWDDYEAGVSLELTGSKLVARTVAAWERWVPRMADSVTCASEALKAKARAYGVPESRLWDAPVGADLDRFQPSAGKPLGGPRLVYAGQLEVASFAQLAVESFSLIAGDFPETNLTVAGGGRYLEDLRRQVEGLGLVKRIDLTGYVDADAIPGILAGASIALAPFEDHEITRCKSPLKIVEYLASGLPVVASAVGEAPRMLEGCGVCVAPGDAGAMAEAVRKLLGDPALRKSLGCEARKRAEERYNWKWTVDRLEEAYKAGFRV